MKNIHKKIIAVLTALVMSASLVACSAPQSAPDNSDTDSTVSVSQSKETTNDSTEESSSAVESKDDSSSEIESEENSSSSEAVSSSESKDSSSASKDVSSSESKDSSSASKDVSSSESKDNSSASKDVSSSESKDSSSASKDVSSSESKDSSSAATSSSSSKVTSSSSSKVSSSSSKDSSKEPEKTEPDEAVMLRQAMLGTTDMAAVAYLGWYEEYYNYSKYSQITKHIKDNNLAEDHPFIAKIDKKHFVPHIGGQLYCIVPADPKATVEIYDYLLDETTFTQKKGKRLFRSTDGKPVIVMGNESEIISNIFVKITDSDGNVLEYSPFLSGYDGKLVLPESAPTVLDFSSYEKLGYTEDVFPAFDPSALYYADQWTAYVETVNDDEVSLGMSFFEDGTVEMAYEIYGGSGFEVFYQGYWYHIQDESLPYGGVELDMKLVADNSDLQIARDSIWSVLSCEYNDYTECLYMYYEAGDYLLDVEKYDGYILHQAMG